MNVTALVSLFGDMPPDSPAGNAIKEFVAHLFADAKHGGSVGQAFRKVVDAGVKVDVAQRVAARQFSGTLVIGDGQAALRDLSQLMGLRLDRSADGYRLDLQR